MIHDPPFKRNYKSQFQKEHSLKQRQILYLAYKKKYPDCFLIIIEKDPCYFNTKGITQQKFLAKGQAQLMQVLLGIRKKLVDIPSSESLFFVNQSSNKILYKSTTIKTLWDQDRNLQDNIIYLRYTGQSDKGGSFKF